MDDSQIIRLYFERSETAIAETDKKYGAFLNQVAYNILRGAEDTEEIVNDTYLGAWNAIPPAKPERLKYFLSRIARNLAINRLDYLQAKRRASMAQQSFCLSLTNVSRMETEAQKTSGRSKKSARRSTVFSARWIRQIVWCSSLAISIRSAVKRLPDGRLSLSGKSNIFFLNSEGNLKHI